MDLDAFGRRGEGYLFHEKHVPVLSDGTEACFLELKSFSEDKAEELKESVLNVFDLLEVHLAFRRADSFIVSKGVESKSLHFSDLGGKDRMEDLERKLFSLFRTWLSFY